MRPVLLVHGLFALPALMRPLRRQLRARGLDVHLAHELDAGVTGDVRRHAVQLDAAVERVRRATGAARVDVVGASQGGLIALCWAARGGEARLGRLVGVGAPFRGSPAAGALGPLAGFPIGLRQLRPGSELLAELARARLAVPVTTVSMRGDPVCPPEACVLPGMREVVVEASLGPITHQLMMFDGRVADAVHRALVDAC